MRTNLNRLAVASVPILLVLMASGCGNREVSSTTTSTSKASHTTMASQQLTSDKALARAANLDSG